MDLQQQARKKIITFLALTFGLSSIQYFLILRAGSMQVQSGLYVFLLMWSPGVAALITQLIFQRNIRGLGWTWGKSRYQLLSYAIPLLYALVAYGVVWITGLGKFPDPGFISLLSLQFPTTSTWPYTSLVIYIVFMATLGILQSCVSALGEEIGWRGLFVPELAKITSFEKTALISGAVWAVWHFPVLLFADYNNGAPAWYSVTCFTLLVIGVSFIIAWMRLKTGSLWSAMLLHASHNLFIQGIFTPLTGDTGITNYIIDEFGIALVITVGITAFLFWLKRDELPRFERRQKAREEAVQSI